MMPPRWMPCALALACGLSGWSGEARAQCFGCSCSVSATPVSFGSYNPLDATDDASTGTITVNCGLPLISLGGSYTIDLSPGSSGNYAQRTLRQGASALNYNLYTSGAKNQIWGDGTGGTNHIVGSIGFSLLYNSQNFQVYGWIPARQNVPAGVYQDAIIVTVTY